MAMANDSWASVEIEPRLIAPVTKRFTISLAGSTSSSGTASPAVLNLQQSLRSVHKCPAWSLMYLAYLAYALKRLLDAPPPANKGDCSPG